MLLRLNGSVMIECGDTSLLVTATKTTKKEASDFLPLICDYEEKLYAAGRIPGGFMRREGRPPERATLIARLIDRPMRPLFPSWMRDEIQIVASCLSLDEKGACRCSCCNWSINSNTIGREYLSTGQWLLLELAF